ncbi:MAG: hypothetical protein OXE99_09260 [Cellvibrionales bacterium]|nr:hypothetical protein [Cellvibrionales bacterium]
MLRIIITTLIFSGHIAESTEYQITDSEYGTTFENNEHTNNTRKTLLLKIKDTHKNREFYILLTKISSCLNSTTFYYSNKKNKIFSEQISQKGRTRIDVPKPNQYQRLYESPVIDAIDNDLKFELNDLFDKIIMNDPLDTLSLQKILLETINT